MKTELNENDLVKKERVGHLKSKINLVQGHLYLTKDRLILQTNKANVGAAAGGLLGALIGSLISSKKRIIDMPLTEIKNIQKGKFGRAVLLEITNSADETFKITVKNYEDWESALPFVRR